MARRFVSRRQHRWAFAADMPFADRWATRGRYRRLPETKATDAAEAQRGTAANTGAGNAPATPATPGGKLTRSESARLAALARWGKYKAKPKAKGGGRGKAPKQTPEQRAAEREAKRRQKAQENRTATLADLDVSEEAQTAMEALAMGNDGEGEGGDELIKMGLAERDKTGALRLTSAGRATYNAASAGDKGRTKEALSRGRDATITAKEKEKAKADAEAEAAEEEKKPKGGGGGGGGSAKPSEDEKRKEQQAKRAKTAQDTAEAVGLARPALDALRAAAEGEGAVDDALVALGLQGADGLTTDQGRRALVALERGDVRQYRAAIQDAQARLAREAERAERDAEREQARAEAERERAERDAEREAAAESRRSARQRREDAMLAPYRKHMTDETKGVPEIAEDAHPGAMVCLVVSDETRDMLRGLVRDAEADHVTLCYLASDAAEIENRKAMLIQALTNIARMGDGVEGWLGGLARFNASAGSDGQDVIVALVDSPDLPGLHAAIAQAVEFCGIESPSEHGFIPHITLAYVDPESATPRISIPREPVVFDALTLVWAGERIDIPFGDEDEDGMAVAMPMGYKALPPAEVDELPQHPGEMKMLDDDTGIAMAVWFGTPEHHDISPKKDFFTKATDFWLEKWDRRPMLYDHAQTDHEVLYAMKAAGASSAELAEMRDALAYLAENPVIGTWTKAWKDTMAVWMAYEIDKAHRYRDAVKEMIRAGVLKVSTDSAPHLVLREPQPNGSNWVKRWPIFAASVTTRAAEPRLHDLGAMKATPDSDPTAIETAAATPEAPAEAVKTADGSSAAHLLVATLTNITARRVAARYGQQ
jgi:2'-5' RNA ligase